MMRSGIWVGTQKWKPFKVTLRLKNIAGEGEERKKKSSQEEDFLLKEKQYKQQQVASVVNSHPKLLLHQNLGVASKPGCELRAVAQPDRKIITTPQLPMALLDKLVNKS